MRCQCADDGAGYDVGRECYNEAVFGFVLCDTCERLGCVSHKTRYARIDVLFGNLAYQFRQTVADYLPRNYEAVTAHAPDCGVVIVGHDDHGWTLDDYVIPRLASGLIRAYEVKS